MLLTQPFSDPYRLVIAKSRLRIIYINALSDLQHDDILGTCFANCPLADTWTREYADEDFPPHCEI